MPGPRTPRRRHLLLIAAFWPPSRASGVFRPLAMANYFVERGWDVTVLTLQEEFYDKVSGSRDDSLLAAVRPEIDVIRVPIPLSHLVRDLRDYSTFRANFPRLHAKLFKPATRLDRYGPWLPALVARALEVNARHRVDVVLATGNPWTSFAAAALMHQVTRVPYVIDYRDAWTLDQFSGEPAFPPAHPAYTWEGRLLHRAAGIVFVNSGTRDWYAGRYPQLAGRMMVVENGYDPDLLAIPGEAQGMFRAPSPDRPLRFGYLGTLTDRYDNELFWNGWTLAQEHPEVAGATAELFGHVGFFATTARAQSKGMPRARVPNAAHRGAVSKADVARTYRDLDVLLFLVPSSPFVTSGKTYEYMATGKPIVAVHAADSAAAAPLRGYPRLAWASAGTPEAVCEALVEGARLARAGTQADHDAAIAHAAAFDRRRLLQPFERWMNRLATRSPDPAGSGDVEGADSQTADPGRPPVHGGSVR